MPSETISGMTAAGEMLNADIFPIVSGGDNYKMSKGLFLKAATGESVTLEGGTTSIDLNVSGDLTTALASGSTYRVDWDGTKIIQISNIGDPTFQGVAGSTLYVKNNGAEIKIGSTGSISLVPNAGETVSIDFIPGASGDWSGDPTTVQEAIDRIAALVASNFGPIP